MKTHQNIRQIIQKTYKNYEIPISYQVITHDTNKKGVFNHNCNAMYQEEEEKVYFYEHNLKLNYHFLKKQKKIRNMDWETYIEIHAIHEPGHHYDQNKKPLTEKRVLLFEKIQEEPNEEKAWLDLQDFFITTLALENNAWDYCFQRMENYYHSHITELKRINIEGYAKSCEIMFDTLRAKIIEPSIS